jgi:AbrB family looped-hinge helix DNA binding protein
MGGTDPRLESDLQAGDSAPALPVEAVVGNGYQARVPVASTRLGKYGSTARRGVDTQGRKSDNHIVRKSVDTETARIGKRGTVVLPARLRRKYGLEEGSLVLVEETPRGLMLRPAATYPVEIYPPARVAEFLLNNATDEADYRRAVEEVRRLGLDPDDIPHQEP